MPRDPKFVDAYNRRTGRKQRVPRAWLALYPDLAETPSSRAEGEVVVGPEQIARITGGDGLAKQLASAVRFDPRPVDPQTPPSAAEDPVPDSGPAAHQED